MVEPLERRIARLIAIDGAGAREALLALGAVINDILRHAPAEQRAALLSSAFVACVRNIE